MAKGQRKQKQDTIRPEVFEELCKIQCTEEEITAILHCCSNTLDAWCMNTYGKHFCEAFKVFSCGGKASLRRNQFKIAESNPTMAIWLGKQYLNQKDNTLEVDTTDEEGKECTQEIILALKHRKPKPEQDKEENNGESQV